MKLGSVISGVLVAGALVAIPSTPAFAAECYFKNRAASEPHREGAYVVSKLEGVCPGATWAMIEATLYEVSGSTYIKRATYKTPFNDGDGDIGTVRYKCPTNQNKKFRVDAVVYGSQSGDFLLMNYFGPTTVKC